MRVKMTVDAGKWQASGIRALEKRYRRARRRTLESMGSRPHQKRGGANEKPSDILASYGGLDGISFGPKFMPKLTG